ncbi:unnamed protein product, partial [Scytosiphon promiscuus]
GDVRASSEYFAGLAELMAALEEERGKADRYLVTLPLPPSEGVSPGGRMLPPVPLVMEALGNVAAAPGLGAAPLTAPARDNGAGGAGGGGKISWSDRMMRRATTAVDGPQAASVQAQQAFLPPTPSAGSKASFSGSAGGGGGASSAGGSTRDSFLGSGGHVRSPTMPSSPLHQRFENLASDFLQPGSSASGAANNAASAAAAKRSRKISLPKSIGRKINGSRSGSGGGSSGGGRKDVPSFSTAAPLLETPTG